MSISDINEEIYSFIQTLSLKYDKSNIDILAQFISEVNQSSTSRLLTIEHNSNPIKSLSTNEIIFYVLMVLFCLICAAFASGLTQGLLSLNIMELKIKTYSKNLDERKNASRIIPLLSYHHLLLVTFMLWNATAMEALPIYLSKLCSEYVAIIISVTCILIFGEIMPASILTGPQQLQIVSTLIPLVYFIIIIFFPLSYPIAKVLDYIIGTDDGIVIYNKNDLKNMIKIQYEEKQRKALSPIDIETGNANKKKSNKRKSKSISNSANVKYELVEDRSTSKQNSNFILDSINKFDEFVNAIISYFTKKTINHDSISTINPIFTNNDNNPSSTTFPLEFEGENEVNPMEYNIINGALTYSTKKVSKFMTKINNIFMLNSNDVLNYELLYKIFQSGFSRIPVCHNNNPNNIIGLLIVKDLIFIDPDDNVIVSNFIKVFGRIPITVWYDDTLDEALKQFQESNSHMAIVKSINYYNNIKDPEYIVVGIITLEDILEEILGKKIYDETDKTNKKLNKIIKDYDWERLKVLKNSKKTIENIYNNDEFINELILFIHNNIKQISNFYTKYSDFNLKKFIEQIGLLKLNKSSTDQLLDCPMENTQNSSDINSLSSLEAFNKSDLKKISSEDIIIRFGKITTSCIIIISGKIRIIEGEILDSNNNIEFNSIDPQSNSQLSSTNLKNKEYILGPWSIINQEVLDFPHGTYFSKLTAIIESDEVRIFCLSYNLYEKFMKSNKLKRVSKKNKIIKRNLKSEDDGDISFEDHEDLDDDIINERILIPKEQFLSKFNSKKYLMKKNSSLSPISSSESSKNNVNKVSSQNSKKKKIVKEKDNEDIEDSEEIISEYGLEMDSLSLFNSKKKSKTVQFIDDSDL